MFTGFKVFNQIAFDRKKESVKAEPDPGFGTSSYSQYKSAPVRDYKSGVSQFDSSYYNAWKGSNAGRSGLDRVFDALQVGQYTVAGAFRGAVSKDHTVIGGIIGGLRASNPFGKGYEEGEASFTDVFSEMGWNPKSKLGKVARGVAGFAGDVLFDPLTYFSGGTSAVLKGTGTTAKVGVKISKELVEKFGKEAAEAITKKAAANLGKGLTREYATETLLKYGMDITEATIDGFVKRTNKLAGVSQDLGNHLMYGIGKNKKMVLDDSILRMLGDATIAPYTSSIPNILNNMGVFKHLDSKSALKALSRYDIQKTANTLLASDIRNRHSVSLAKNIVSSKQKMVELTKGLDDKQKLQVLDILDDTELFKTNLTTTGLIDNDFGKRLIKRYEDQLAESNNIIKSYDDLLSEKEKLVSSSDKLVSSMAKLERGSLKSQLNKFKEFDVVLKDTRDKIKLSLFDINNEAKNQIVKHKIIDYRKSFKTGKVSVKTGKDVYTTLPYANKKIGKYIKPNTGKEFLFDDYLNKSMSNFTKVNEKQVYATSSKSVNSFLDIKHSNETLYDKLSYVMNSNPILAEDLSMMPLRAKLTDKQLKEALSMYSNKSADEFFDFSKTLREGYDESKAIASVELDKALKLADSPKATSKAYTDYYKRIDELILKEDIRLPLYVKNIDASDSLLKTRKANQFKTVDYKDIVNRKNQLDDKMLSGAMTNSEMIELDELSKVLDKSQRKLIEGNQMLASQKTAKSSFGVMSEAEIDNALRTDYGGQFEEALARAEFDPWEDIEVDSLKALESEEFVDAFLDGSDLVRNSGKMFEPEFNLGKYAKAGEADARSIIAAKAFDEVLNKTISMEDMYRQVLGYAVGPEAKHRLKVKLNRIQDLLYSNPTRAEKELKILKDELLVKKAKDKTASAQEFLDELFNQPAKAKAGINVEQAEQLQKAKLAKSLNESKAVKAKALNLTEKQLDNLDSYLHVGFEDIVKDISKINKRRVRSFKKSLLQKYFPDKRLKDLTTAEREIIDGLMDDAVKRGVIEQVDNKQFYDALLEKTDIKISELGDQMEAIELNLSKTKDGYWVQNKSTVEKIKGIDDTLQDSVLKNKVDEARGLQEALTKTFNENKIDDYARSQLGMAYDQFVDWRLKDYSKLITSNLKDIDPKVIKAVNKIRESLDIIGTLEGTTKVKGYFPHIVKEKYQKLFNNYAELTKNAIVGSDGRPFISSNIKRSWEGSIREYQKSWAEHFRDFGKPPVFKDSNIVMPRDLYEDDLVKALTERTLMHENYIFDSNNSKAVYDLVTRKYDPKKALEGLDISVITKEDLVKNFKNTVKEGQDFTTDYVIKKLADEGIVVKFRPDDLYAEVISGQEKLYGKVGKDGNRMFNVKAMDQNVLNHFNKLSKYQKSEGIQKVLDVYDNMLHLWKLGVTVVNPSFHARNALGNSFNSYLDIGTKAFSFKEKKKIMNIMSGDFTGKIIGANGVKYSAEEIIQIGIQLDVIDSGQFGYEIRKLMNSTKGSASKWAKYNPLSSTEFLPYKVGTKVGSDIENMDRMLNFIHHIESGLEPKLAADFTNKFLFDYKNATVFEKEVLRRAIPFWTWAKKNIPLQIEQVIKHPEKYRPFAKGLQTLNKSNIGDPSMDFDKGKRAGSFAEDWVTLPGTGDSSVNIFNPNMPFQDLSVDMKDLIGRLSPFIKTPVELALNHDSYYGNEIDSKLLHIAKQIGPYSAGKKLVQKQGSDRVLEILAQLTGLRFLSYSQEKYNYRKIINDTNKLTDKNNKE